MSNESAPILCVGEVLWDSLPRGLFLGGAPMNVAYHLHALGRAAVPVSAVGSDALGHEVRRRLAMWGIADHLLTNATAETGRVEVIIDQAGIPSYTILSDVAWDQIAASDAVLSAAEQAPAIVYGSLAQRGPDNRAALASILSARSGLAVYDVNLRAPFDDMSIVTALATDADLIKLNDEELERLAPGHGEDLEAGASYLANETNTDTVVVTAGPRGAGILHQGRWTWADGNPISVRDTVGAGDSFMATTLDGLLAGRSLESVITRAVRIAEWVATCDGATPDHADAPPA